jgi:endo-1,4-beta-mannosidase
MSKKDKFKTLRILFLVFLFSFTILVLCSTINQKINQKTPLIVRDGSHLIIQGTDQRFRFLGGNNFNLLVKYLWGNYYGLTGREVFETSSAYNITVIRFWATCSNGYWSDQCLYLGPNNWNSSKEKFFEKFDELVDDADKYHVYLIPVLSDAYFTFNWVGGSTEICQVGSKANIEYKNFVRDVVTRYRDKKIILAWEIGNEGQNYCSRYGDLLNWYTDTANYIKGLDPSHLISTGENNFGSLDKTEFKAMHSNENITLASVHIYDRDMYEIENGKSEREIVDFISYWTSVSHNELEKPVYFGEFGSYNVSSNPEFYNDFMKAAYNSDVDGIMIWSWLEGAECSRPANKGGSCITPTRTPSIADDVRYWASKFKQEYGFNK